MAGGWPEPLQAQWGGMFPSSQFELSDAVQLDQVDTAVRGRIGPCQAAAGRSPVGRGRRNPSPTVGDVGRKAAWGYSPSLHQPARLVPVASGCPPARSVEALPQPRRSGRAKWYEQGIADRDPKPLRNIVDQAFASSFGDDALMALGEIALESGDFAAARWNWERIIPVHKTEPTTGGAAVELPPQRNMLPQAWPSYPDTDFDLAVVRARLVLVSIFEGATARARGELAAYRKLHPDAQGRLGGRDGRYVQLLESLLAESVSWPATPSDADWPTFAGNPQRNKTTAPLLDVGAVAWRVPLRPAAAPPSPMGAKTAGEDSREPLSFFPLMVGRQVLINTAGQVLAMRCNTGQPAWGRTAAIYESELTVPASGPVLPLDSLGSPRFTATVFRDRLFARMGSTVTDQARGSTPDHSTCLVCLDLAAEGRLLWKIAPEEGWAFEGSPLADGRGVYVAMRRQDIRPQAFVACFDADTGRFRWRRFVCSAETPARGILPEQTHNLLTLSSDTLYYNTNLGAVAAFGPTTAGFFGSASILVRCAAIWPNSLRTGDVQ